MGILNDKDIENIRNKNLGNSWSSLNPTSESGDNHFPIVAIKMGEKLEEEYWLWSHFDQQYHLNSSQGSQADFAPCSQLEFDLVKSLKENKNNHLTRVTVEQILSNRGVIEICKFLRQCNINPPPNPQEIIADILGRECGNIALKILCYGGLYLVENFPNEIRFVLEENVQSSNFTDILRDQQGRFINAFTQKGRVSHCVKKIPVYLKNDTREDRD